MNILLSDARSFLRPYVDAGTTSNTKIDSRINEATQHLITVADWKLLVKRVRILVPSTANHITLPQSIEKIMAVNPDHIPANVFSQYYEFLEGGPGRIDNFTNTPCKDLADLGMHCTYADPPTRDINGDEFTTPLSLIALSTSADDVTNNLKVTVRGRGRYNNPIIDSSGDLGEDIDIIQWKDGIEGQLPALSGLQPSTNGYKLIDFLKKPETKGHVTVYSYNPNYTTGAGGEPMLHYIGKYNSWETQPMMRRYSIINQLSCTHLTCLVKLAYQPVALADDPLLIQSLIALKAMVQALNFYDADEQNKGEAKEAQALRILDNQLKDTSQSGTEITVQESFGLGEVEGII